MSIVIIHFSINTYLFIQATVIYYILHYLHISTYIIILFIYNRVIFYIELKLK